MIILAIETSCDDTCIALAECSASPSGKRASPAGRPACNPPWAGSIAGRSANKFKLLSNLVSSQVEIHQKWGGVYPALARREHQKNLTPLLIQALREANLIENVKCQMSNVKSIPKSKCQKLKKILERESTLCKKLKKFLGEYQKPKIDLIAVTIGPGLDPCLWTGVNFAKALAYYWNLPIAGINHIEAHIFANWLKPISLNVKRKTQNAKPQRKAQKLEKIEFPAICLIVSGGHTQLILIKKLGDYKILGETRDDAAGEAFDKIARILGLGYPGGPAISVAAEKFLHGTTPGLPAGENGVGGKERMWAGKGKDGSGVVVKLPRPMLYSKNYDFSFSGLKTAVLYNYKRRTKKERESKKYIEAMAYEAQQAIIDILIKKTIKAAKDYRVKSILLGGGVTANKELRKQFQEKIKKEKLKLLFNIPCSNYCTDNAAMIAITACFKQVSRDRASGNSGRWQKITAQPNLRLK